MTDTIWVFCAGMRRSGSALQYHIARDVVLERGGVDGGWIPWQEFDDLYQKHDGKTNMIVVKSHVYFPKHTKVAKGVINDRRYIAMTIYRDIRDVIASSKRLKVLNIQRQITGYVSEFAAWTSVPDILVSRYEDIVDNIPLEVQRIRNHMGVYTSPERLQKISWKYERDNMKTLQTQGLNKEGYSKKHHLWSNHVGSGKVGRWRDELTHDEAQEVAHLVGGWLKKHGYN